MTDDMTTSLPTDPPSPGGALTGGQINRAAGIIMAALLLSGILGLVRQMVVTAAFGAGRELDAFYAASRVPETLFVLVAGGALASAFIPVFSDYLAKDETQGAWKLASATLTYMVLLAIGVSALIFVFAEYVVANLLVPSADAAAKELTVELMRVMLATVVIFGVSGLVMGILNGHQHFLTPALAPSMYNVGIIIGAVGLAPSMGVHGLALGTVLGAGLHLIVQIPSLLRLPFVKLRIDFTWRGSGVGEVFWLMGPRVLGLSIVQVNFWVNAVLTSDMQAGSLAALQTAFTLMFTILGILGQSIGTAVFPTLSRLHAEKDTQGFGATLLGALSNVLFLSIPAGLGLAVLSEPLITVLFERGDWTAVDTAGTAWALSLFAVGLAGHAVLEVLARAFYALHDTWTPVRVGGITMILNIILSLILIRVFGYPGDVDFERGPFGGLALSMSIATALESTVLWVLLRRRIHLNDLATLAEMGKMLASALIMVAGVGVWMQFSTTTPPFIRLMVGVVLGAAIFWSAAGLLQIRAARAVPRLIWARLGRTPR